MVTIRYKLYKTDSVLSFGKHKEKSLIEIVRIDPSYLDWCITEVSDFYLDNSFIEELKKINPKFKLSLQGQSVQDVKQQELDRMNDESYRDFLDRTNSDKMDNKALNQGYLDAFEGDSSNFFNVD